MILHSLNAVNAEKVHNESVFPCEKNSAAQEWLGILFIKPLSSNYPDSTPQSLFRIVSELILRIRCTFSMRHMSVSSSHNARVLILSVIHYGASGYISIRFLNEWWYWTTFLVFSIFLLVFDRAYWKQQLLFFDKSFSIDYFLNNTYHIV